MQSDRDDRLVTNAADVQQVGRARLKESDRIRRDADDLRWVLSDVRGRRFFWRLLSLAHLFNTITNTVSSAAMYVASGRRDYGLELLAWAGRDAAEHYLLMEAEARERERREDTENAAVRTPAAPD